MKNLSNLYFEPIYFKNRMEIYESFYKPCMENSVQYDRVTGYFGSSVFLVINDSLRKLYENGGKIRIICSPVLTPEDYEAIKNGYNQLSDESVSSLNFIFEQMEIEFPNTSLLLSYFIRLGFIEIKLSVFGDNPSAYRLLHDKVGLFKDEYGNSVCFRGSINETFRGVSRFGNSESFDVDKSWGDNIEKVRVKIASDQFEHIWQNIEPGITTFNLPDITEDKISGLQTEKNLDELFEEVKVELDLVRAFKVHQKLNKELVLGERLNLSEYFGSKYKFQVESNDLVKVDDNILTACRHGKTKIKIMDDDGKIIDDFDIKVVKWGAEPGINRRKVRDYQIEILENWLINSSIGILEMATGSGKTFTAMCAIRYQMYVNNKIPVIIVPRNLLFEQWKNEIKKSFGDEIDLLLYGNNNFSTGLKPMTYPSEKKVVILATIQTASKDEFAKTINQGKHLFLVIDEVHNAGSTRFSEVLKIMSGPRLGLSATPIRFRDPTGTSKIFDYFNKSIEPKYTLEDAIKGKTLCEYFYFPETVKLSITEADEYKLISDKISKRYAILKNLDYTETQIFEDSEIKFNLIKRSDIVKKAQSKVELVKKIIQSKYEKHHRWLIYCDDTDQLSQVKVVLNQIKNINQSDVYEYHSTSNNKDEILGYFEDLGGILLSINCLDEGVDIPSIDHVIILSSSQNERQFIQRRGRVLRQSPETKKIYSYIYDAVVSAEGLDNDENVYPFLTYEVLRAKLFAKNAVNYIDAESKLSIIEIKNIKQIIDLGDE